MPRDPASVDADRSVRDVITDPNVVVVVGESTSGPEPAHGPAGAAHRVFPAQQLGVTSCHAQSGVFQAFKPTPNQKEKRINAT